MRQGILNFMTEYEKDKAMWESYCESHKGSKVVNKYVYENNRLPKELRNTKIMTEGICYV